MSKHEQEIKANKELKYSQDNAENNKTLIQRNNIPSDINYNQDPLRYVTVTKLGFIPMECGTILSVLTSYFKVNECGRCKLDIEHHYGVR